MNNAVEVSSTGQVVVSEVEARIIELAVPATPVVVEVATAGPQGPTTPSIGDIGDVNTAGAVDKSVLYYDNANSVWRGDDINTIVTLTDGGNF
jgi:hypothetical protein